jgi:hypothetical protein
MSIDFLRRWRACVARVSCVLVAYPSFAAHATSGFPPFTQEAIPRGVVYPVQGIPQSSGLYGFGVAAADLDHDGDDDLVVVGRQNGQVGLFENDGTGRFVNRVASSGIAPLAQASAIAIADLDGDRLPEILFTQVGQPHRLYRNLGAFAFATMPSEASLAPSGAAKAASFGDLDGDGDLDLFLANYLHDSGPYALVRNQLFRNDGGHWSDIAGETGIDAPGRTFLGVWSDIDRDGDPDLYISNDRGHLGPLFAENALWRNDDGRLVDASAGSGADVACFSMGVASGDFDGDGHLDFLVTNIPANNAPVFGVNPLLLGNGDATFTRGEALWQVEDMRTGWGALFVDLDDDGRLDLFVNHQGTANALWRNPGAPPAVEIANAGGAAGVPSKYNYSTVASDLDGDGDLDLVSLGLGANLLVYMNHAGDGVASVRLRLEGRAPNADAIGARVEARRDGRLFVREVQAGGVGYLGQSTLEVHLGLDAAEPREGRAGAAFDEIVVLFPDGAERRMSSIAAGAYGVVHPALLGDGNGNGAPDADDLDAAIAVVGTRARGAGAWFDYDGDGFVTPDDLARMRGHAADLRADLDGDGIVGLGDLALLVASWGAPTADLDLDRTTGGGDLAQLLARWTMPRRSKS